MEYSDLPTENSSNETVDQTQDADWNNYLSTFRPNARMLIDNVMLDPEVQAWARIKAMDSLLAPYTHPDHKSLDTMSRYRGDLVDMYGHWINNIGIEEAEHMAQKIPVYKKSIKEEIDQNPGISSSDRTTLVMKLADYDMMIPRVVKKLQDLNPDKAEELLDSMSTIDPDATDDEGRILSAHIGMAYGDYFLQEKWKRKIASKVHEQMRKKQGQGGETGIINEYTSAFNDVLGQMERGAHSPVSKTFFEDEISYLLEVGNGFSGIKLRHTMTALELLSDNPDLAHKFARAQILPEKEFFWIQSSSDKSSVKDLLEIADMFPEDQELVKKLEGLEAMLHARDEELSSNRSDRELILDRLKIKY